MEHCDNSEEHEIVLVQYGYDDPHHYDGVSEKKCLTCGRRTGRWCGNKLEDDEVEPRFCDGSEHPKLTTTP